MNDSTAVKLHIHGRLARTGRCPRVSEMARDMAMPEGRVRAACAALEDEHLLVLAPETGEVVMAPPFSAVATSFEVDVGGVRYYAPCAWDALGVSAALAAPGVIRTSCADCGDPIQIRVGLDGPEDGTAVVHFAAPASKWWDDIVYT